jgi:hypothetical protein
MAAPRPQQMALSKVLDGEDAAGADLSTPQILAGEGDNHASTQALYGALRPLTRRALPAALRLLHPRTAGGCSRRAARGMTLPGAPIDRPSRPAPRPPPAGARAAHRSPPCSVESPAPVAWAFEGPG